MPQILCMKFAKLTELSGNYCLKAEMFADFYLE